ncbi:MAG: DNRLRE domain-containing protein [Candidatus Gastranaerophilaceae bacterium]
MFVVNELFALDAAGAYTDDVKVTYISNGAAPKLRVTVDSAFLTDESREYPIVIDPSVMVTGANNIADSFVRQGSPSTNYKYDEKLFTGNSASNGLQRAYIKFTLPGNISATSVTSAKVRIKRYGGSPTGIKAYRVTSGWSSGGITWNNKPGYSSSYVSNTAYNDGGEWYAMDVSSTVRNWLNGAYTNYGFALISNYESSPSSSISYYSSDAPSPNKPELIINYTDSGTYYGNRPYVQNNGEAANCMGYVLDMEMHINADELDIDVGDLNQKSISYIHNFYVSKIEEWMDKNIAFRNWARIASYNSDIGLNQYRLVNRTGFHDIKVTIPGARRDLNDVWDKPSGLWYEEWPGQDENFDNHWWYQTNTGYWAEKPSKTEPSNRIPVYSPLNESYWWDYSHKSEFTYYKIDTKGI